MSNLECPGNISLARNCLKPVLRFQKWDLVLLLQKREDWLFLDIMGDDLLADFERQVGLIKRNRQIISQPHPLKPDGFCASHQTDLARYDLTRIHNSIVDQSG